MYTNSYRVSLSNTMFIVSYCSVDWLCNFSIRLAVLSMPLSVSEMINRTHQSTCTDCVHQSTCTDCVHQSTCTDCVHQSTCTDRTHQSTCTDYVHQSTYTYHIYVHPFTRVKIVFVLEDYKKINYIHMGVVCVYRRPKFVNLSLVLLYSTS